MSEQGLPIAYIQTTEVIDKTELLGLSPSVYPAFGKPSYGGNGHPSALSHSVNEILVNAVHEAVEDLILISSQAFGHRHDVRILSGLMAKALKQ